MINSLGFNSADLSDQWTLLGGATEEATHNVYAMKVLFLGPFLFGQSTLSEQVRVLNVCTSIRFSHWVILTCRLRWQPLTLSCCLLTGEEQS